MVSGLNTVLKPSALIQNEASKVNKYGPFYAPLGFSFLPICCFLFLGALGLLPSVSYMRLQVMNWLNMMIG